MIINPYEDPSRDTDDCPFYEMAILFQAFLNLLLKKGVIDLEEWEEEKLRAAADIDQRDAELRDQVIRAITEGHNHDGDFVIDVEDDDPNWRDIYECSEEFREWLRNNQGN